MSKRFLMVLVAFLTIGVQAFAQTTVSGKVTDAKGEAVIGAGVQVKGTQTGTVTDLDGAYKLAGVSSNSVLVFSCIGYKDVEVTVGSQKVINVVLAEDSEYLDEVVVVGYGTARRKDVSGAIASMNFAKDKNSASLPNPNALAALSSKVAGFSYAPTSSAGGDNTSTMTIRGMNVIPKDGSKSSSSQSLNQPLLVIDGVVSYDSINSINTNDIESIDVLKDASAAAIYGSRAANGVIIITTKRGQSDKPQVNFNASVSFSDWSRMPKYVTDEETFFRNRFYSKAANDAELIDQDWAKYDKLTLMTSVESDAYAKGVYTNWIKEISRIGVGQKYDLSVSGRSNKVNYYIAADYTRTQGIRIGDDYRKYTALAKVDANITDWLTIGLKGNYLGGESWGTPARIQNATWMSPYSFVKCQIPGYEEWYNSTPDGNTASPLWGTQTNDSYLWTDSSSKNSNINGVLYAQVDFPFLKGLSYKITLQGQKNFSNSDMFANPEIWVNTNIPAQMDDPLSVGGTLASGSSSANNNSVWNIDNILTYTKDFGKHHIDAMVGYVRDHKNYNSLSGSYTGYSTSTALGIYDSYAAETHKVTRGRVESSSVSYLARLNYNWANKYYVTGNFRRDGYSVFAPGHKWDNFYGASAAWVISNENFVKDNVQWIDFLKLRLSYGQNGSRTVSEGATTATVGTGTLAHAWLGEASAPGVYVNQLPNHSLGWAKVTKADLGIDFSVLGGRLSGSIDGYLGKTTDMLVQRSAPYFTGYDSVNANAGLVTNNGVEVSLSSVNINGNGQDKFRWESNLVFYTNSNKLVDLYDGTESDVASYVVAPESNYALVKGHPITAAYDYKLLGVFQSQKEIDDYTWTNPETKEVKQIMPSAKPGDLKFEDTNNDGQITALDRHVIGTTDPLFTVNFGNTLSWKGFSLYFNFRWMQGDKTHFLGLDPNAFGTSMGGGNQLARIKPWSDAKYYKNLTNEFPRYGYVNSFDYQFWNSRSFLKLKDLSFSYSIPEKVCKSIGMAGLRIYIAGTDLFTITNWSGLDPETGGTIAAGAASSRYGANGTYKTYTMGVNLTF